MHMYTSKTSNVNPHWELCFWLPAPSSVLSLFGSVLVFTSSWETHLDRHLINAPLTIFTSYMLTLPVSCLVLKSVAENKSDESGAAGQKTPKTTGPDVRLHEHCCGQRQISATLPSTDGRLNSWWPQSFVPWSRRSTLCCWSHRR